MTFSYKVFAGCVSFYCHSFKQDLIEDYTYVHVIYYASASQTFSADAAL